MRKTGRWLAPLAGIAALALGLAAPASAATHPRTFGPVHRTYAGHTTRNTRAALLAHGPNETASTSLILRPDSGYNATVWWAYDDFTRTVNVVRGNVVPGTDCGLAASHVCYDWTATFSDHGGSFQTIAGQDSPGYLDKILNVAERGTFSGTQHETVFDSYANAYPSDVPLTENDNGQTTGTSSTWWPCQFFGGAGFCHPQGAAAFSYSYAVAKGADAQCPAGSWHWTDTSASGNIPANGDILAPDKANCATSPNTGPIRLAVHYHTGPGSGVTLASDVRLASHGPQIAVGGEYEFQNVADALWLRTATGGGVVYDSTGATKWVSQNLHNNMYVQLRAVGTNNLCIWADSSGVSARTCSTANGGDYFYVEVSSEGGHTAWFRPYDFSNDFGTDDAYFHGNHDFVIATAGAGNYAIWAWTQLN